MSAEPAIPLESEDDESAHQSDQRVKPIVPVGLGFEWETGLKGIVLQADRIAPYYGNDLQAEIRVLHRNQRGQDSHIHMNNYVISRPEGREKLLASLIRHPQFRKWGISSGNPRDLDSHRNDDLFVLVEQFCTGVQLKKRSSIEVNFTHQRAKTPIQYLVDSLILKSNRPNLIFAPGGAGKSYFLAAVCVAMMTKRGIGNLSLMDGCIPGYFDWEDDFRVFEDRINTVSRGYGFEEPPLVPHFKLRGGTIPDQINEMALLVNRYHLNVGFIDSMSAAAGTTGGGKAWDEISHSVFNALELIPDVTWVIIGHVDKAHLSKPAGAMFGSIQTMNRSCNAWEVRSEQTPDAPVVHMKFHDSKHNHTGLRSVIGMSMTFDNDAVIFESESADSIPGNLLDRMTLALMNGTQLSRGDLAEKLQAQYGSITTALSRDKATAQKTGQAPRFTMAKGSNLITLNPQWDGTADEATEEAKEMLSEAPAESLPW